MRFTIMFIGLRCHGTVAGAYLELCIRSGCLDCPSALACAQTIACGVITTPLHPMRHKGAALLDAHSSAYPRHRQTPIGTSAPQACCFAAPSARISMARASTQSSLG